MKKHGFVWIVAAMLFGVGGLAGCNRQEEGVVLNFVFEDARGITVGAKVMADGVFVGQVIAPPQSDKPNQVVVSARIDRLSEGKKTYLTKDLSASIEKSSLVAGETNLELIFPKEPGTIVGNGTYLKGRGGSSDIIGMVTDFNIPDGPKEFFDRLQQAFVASDPKEAGATIFYLNWACLVVVALVLVSLILDFVLRLPQGAYREHSSPRVFREIWLLFFLSLLLRVLAGAVRVLGGSGFISGELLRAIRIGSCDLMDLLKQDWPFWAVALFLITLRFKFQLLTRVRSK